jgi:hypothetical protein
MGPDELVSGLFGREPNRIIEVRIIEVARMHRKSLTRPSKTPEEYTRLLRNCGLEETARLLKERLDRI